MTVKISGMGVRSGNRRRCRGTAILALAVVSTIPVIFAQSARADDFWNVTTGNWNTTGSWFGGVPQSGDTARIQKDGAVASLDVSSTINALAIGAASNGSSATLQQTNSNNYSLTETGEFLGVSTGATGAHQQSTGTNNVTSLLDIGDDAGAIGTYTLSGSALTVINLTGATGGTDALIIGDAGNGTLTQQGGIIYASVPVYLGYDSSGLGVGVFNQTGGVTNIGNINGSAAQNLYLGYTSGSHGTYYSAATLNVSGNTYVGGNGSASEGTGILNVSAGNTTISGQLVIWNSTGSVNLSGGTLSVGSLNTNGSPAGFLGNGTTTGWTGGTLSITNSSLTVGSGGTLGSSLTLNNGQTLNITGSGQSLTVTGTMNVNGGGLSAPTITQSAGTFTDTGTLTLASSGGNATTYNLNGGTLSANFLSTTGTPSRFNWSSGTFNLSPQGLSSGAFNLDNTGPLGNGLSIGPGMTFNFGNSAVSNWSYFVIGQNSAASVTQTGGSASIYGSLLVGESSSSSSSYTMSGNSTLNATALIVPAGPAGSNGSFIQNGGAVVAGPITTIFVGSNVLDVGVSSGGSGSYTLSGSNTTLTANGNAGVGSGGNGTLTINTGAAATVTGALTVYNTSGTAVNLAGGTLSVGTLATSGNSSRFNWTGGTLNLTNSSLTVGSGGVLGSSLTLNGGQNLNITGAGQSLTVTGTMNVNGGGLSAPTINQTAGNFSSTGTLTLAATGGNATVYGLNGGTLTTGALAVNTGGTFNWTSGTLNLTNSSLAIGAGSTTGSVAAEAWGNNGNGQLGNNSTTNSSTAVAVTGLTSGVNAIAAGADHSLAVQSGTVYAWGYNGNGELGNNSTTDSHVPVAVVSANGFTNTGVTAIAAGYDHSLAVQSGSVYAWGYNGQGQLGNNSTTDSHVPVALASPLNRAIIYLTN